MKKTLIISVLASGLVLIGSVIFFLLKQNTDINHLPGYPVTSGKLAPSQVKTQPNFEFPGPTLDSIFADDHHWTASLSAEKTVTLIATGDVIPARSVNQMTVKNNDFTWAFKNIAALANTADLTIINLETPLIRSCPITVEGMVFCGDSRHIQGLLHAGVDIANLANNHSGNHGEEGIKETVNALSANGISVTGTGSALIRETKGVKFAFLGYNDIEKYGANPSPADENTIRDQIMQSRKIADVIVVSYHWGTEYLSQPEERQIALGHLAIDSGADLVIGNHPHWIQPVEIYKGKFIAYAHGNTVFDQMWSEKTKEGVIGKYTFFGNKLADVEYFPVYIKNYGQPEVVTNGDKDRILDGMKSESFTLEDRLKTL